MISTTRITRARRIKLSIEREKLAMLIKVVSVKDIYPVSVKT